jgi:hypothetical protein
LSKRELVLNKRKTYAKKTKFRRILKIFGYYGQDCIGIFGLKEILEEPTDTLAWVSEQELEKLARKISY